MQSRYYDPEVGRFINADLPEYAMLAAVSIRDGNLFSYCGNNPIVSFDRDGEVWETIFDVLSLAASIVDVANNPSDPWAWAGLIGDTLDLIPFVTGVGEITKAASATYDVIDAIDDVHDAAKAVDDSLDAIKTAANALDAGTNTAYIARDAQNIIEYVEITNDFNRRSSEWEKVGRQIEEFVPNLSRDSARYVEQAVIDVFGMKKNGGILNNLINSIATTNKKYTGYQNFFKTIF